MKYFVHRSFCVVSRPVIVWRHSHVTRDTSHNNGTGDTDAPNMICHIDTHCAAVSMCPHMIWNMDAATNYIYSIGG